MYKYIALAAAFVLALVASYTKGYSVGHDAGMKSVMVEFDKYKLAQERSFRDQMLDNERERKRMELAVAAGQMEKEREIKSINARHRATLDSLRSRPDRGISDGSKASTTETATAVSSGAVCTGEGLSKQDAEFLAGEAADANILREALKATRQFINGTEVDSEGAYKE